jgi:hypothetical protein
MCVCVCMCVYVCVFVPRLVMGQSPQAPDSELKHNRPHPGRGGGGHGGHGGDGHGGGGHGGGMHGGMGGAPPPMLPAMTSGAQPGLVRFCGRRGMLGFLGCFFFLFFLLRGVLIH